MSHTTTIKSVAIRDANAIRKAVEELKEKGINIKLREDSVPRMYYATQGTKCDFVLNLPDSMFDVGLKLQKDGTYSIEYDEWNNQVGNVIGAACRLPSNPGDRSLYQLGQFLQSYAKNAAINAAAAQGFMVESAELDKEGNVQLMLASY